MGRWVDIPAHRVWVLPRLEFYDDYELLGEHGQVIPSGYPFCLARRQADGRLFRVAPVYGEVVTLTAHASDQIVLVAT